MKMRIRFKPWARPELEASKFYIDNPEEYKGKWKELFNNSNPIHIELGCGKGGFISNIAVYNPHINYIAIDLVDAMLGLAKRKIEEEYKLANREIDNIYITRYDIERINNILSKDDEIERIYINFCNPWPRGKHRKKRLTHTRQLEKYKEFLKARIRDITGHLDNRVAAQFVADNYSPDLKYIFLCHLSHDNNTPEIATHEMQSALEAKGLTVGKGEGTLSDRAKDIQVVALPRFIPSMWYVLRRRNSI